MELNLYISAPGEQGAVSESIESGSPITIHSKSWIRWILESADKLEFSAERLSENAKNINSAIC